jgi:hypothetical protein
VNIPITVNGLTGLITDLNFKLNANRPVPVMGIGNANAC